MDRLLEALVRASVRNRFFVLAGTLVFAAFGAWSFHTMTFDAFPDLTNVQVQVVTASPGMASSEVEMLVTVPIERSLGGLPGVQQVRSLSRAGVSAITVVFEDGTDPWLARQLTKERLDLARGDIPPEAGTPELGPPSTGLGEVYQFTLASDRHPMPELYRIFERDVAPRLRTVDGVVEVNAWGAGAPQLHVRVDPFRLAALGLPLPEVHEAVRAALGVQPGGAVGAGAEQILVRGVANPLDPERLGEVPIPLPGDGAGSVPLRDVADIELAGALTVGLGSAQGEGERLFAMVQLLAGADARRVVAEVRERVAAVEASLPDGVHLDTAYDRDKLVSSTLGTIAKSLAEGGALVILVLLVLLGDLRAGLLVASVIPLAMLGAFAGMRYLGFSGNLMSLGAIDFGLIVDGTIVVTESIVALHLTELGARGHLGPAIVARARRVARPVVFAVGVLLLVYTPILLLGGTEGKLFRPMAVTVLLALATALVLTFTYVPALATLLLRPHGERQTWVERQLARLYAPVVTRAVRRPAGPVVLALAVVAVSGVAGTRLGLEFVPRLEEGDLVLQTARLPSLTPEQALRENTRIERVLRGFPEVLHVATRTGSPAVATDPMGLEESDMLITLAPRDRFTTAQTTEDLVEAMARRVEAEAPGALLTFTQPIEMRFNEMLEGITSDVGVIVYGQDLEVLMAVAREVAAALAAIPGAADVKLPSLEGVPGLDVEVRQADAARVGLSAEAVLDLVADLKRGTEVGLVTRGQFRDAVVVTLDLPPELPIAQIPVVLPEGGAVPLEEVADVREVSAPANIQREAGSRRVIVQANVRGRDLGSFVQQAQARVGALTLPEGTWIDWSGQYEQLRDAAVRTGILIPAVLFLILGVLYVTFHSWRAALLIFLNVPVAISGGVLALWARDLPLSMSAVVGFIALFGIAVMNGIVLLSRTRELHTGEGAEGRDGARAALASALERFRPVVMTAAVAGIGFVPMAVATGMGAEVQRPLATVVIGGLVTCTGLTLVVLPAVYARVFARDDRVEAGRAAAAAVG